MRLARGVDELLPADGYISTAAHLGRPDVLTSWNVDGGLIYRIEEYFDLGQLTAVLSQVSPAVAGRLSLDQHDDH